MVPQGVAPKQPEMINFSKFFTYMNCTQKFMMVIGTIGAIVAGVLLPSLAIVMGAVTNTYNPSNTKDQVLDQMKTITLYICLVGLGTWLFGYLYFAFWQHLAQMISFDLRSRYLHAILKQEVAFFEMNNVEQLPSQIGENFFIVTESIGEKYSNIIYSFSTLIGGIGIAFYLGADFAGVCAAFVPIIMMIMIIFGGIVKKATLKKMAVVK